MEKWGETQSTERPVSPSQQRYEIRQWRLLQRFRKFHKPFSWFALTNITYVNKQLILATQTDVDVNNHLKNKLGDAQIKFANEKRIKKNIYMNPEIYVRSYIFNNSDIIRDKLIYSLSFSSYIYIEIKTQIHTHTFDNVDIGIYTSWRLSVSPLWWLSDHGLQHHLKALHISSWGIKITSTE